MSLTAPYAPRVVRADTGIAQAISHIDSKASTAGSVYLNWFSGTGGVRCGNGAAGYGIAYAAEFQAVSDRRLKENISYFDSGLAKILQLKPATFDFINGENNQKGFIAQDVEAVIPEVVRTHHNARFKTVVLMKLTRI